MKNYFRYFLVLLPLNGMSQYAPAANEPGTTAIHKTSSAIVSWATHVVSFNRGFEDIATMGNLASFGDSLEALGAAQGNSTDVVSLGDAGEIVLGFDYPIKNGMGPDFAVFENSFSHTYLEFAHVEVSTDGVRFVRIPSYSMIPSSIQTWTYATSDPTKVHNLAGKYIQGYGTPFDLQDIIDSSGVNLDSIQFIKIIDVVGTINSIYGSFDSQGNIINDPYPSEFESGGFDLDAVAVINENNIFASLPQSEAEIQIYPNPSNGVFKITGYSGQFLVYDITGNLIKSGQVENNEQLRFEDLTRGIYLLQLGNHMSRIIIE